MLIESTHDSNDILIYARRKYTHFTDIVITFMLVESMDHSYIVNLYRLYLCL